MKFSQIIQWISKFPNRCMLKGREGSQFIMKNDLLLAQTQKIIKLCLWSEWNMNLNGEQLLSMLHGCERVINILSSVLVQQFLCMTHVRCEALELSICRDLIRRIRCYILQQLLLENWINYFAKQFFFIKLSNCNDLSVTKIIFLHLPPSFFKNF
mgnify:CR=1 FL=1